MVTPFTEGAKTVDYPALEKLVDWYIQHGVDGLFAVCQSSEMFFLSREERREMARFVVEKAAGRAPVVVSGHISDAIEDQIAELKDARDSGADAVVLVSNRLAREEESDEVWKANARRILDAIPDCVFGIYECPYPYKRLLTPELLKWCAQTGRFAFIKDTCCDLTQIKAKLDAIRGSGIKLFNANSATLLESMRMGAAGFCGVMANFHPELYVRLTHRWKGNRQVSEMLQHFAAVTSFAELQMYPVSAKYHLSLCGAPIRTDSRVKDCRDFTELRQIETRSLLGLWQDYQRLLPDQQ
ncbi:MAG TPA: dihydrodipicolinate synthase family protein [Candidatus Merdivicinus excrementipullorum]|uniref:Dihydrodipicolinate synthase family protein n=1 Tax=Candidatus Merdivicinus excrementipullorum TaxID=2840867 RepID=A0A9D1FKU7_9FIRM|nr:dihydrodipicolinate synthase family protein [Candidatus Merdivicinus excrementipullorum]